MSETRAYYRNFVTMFSGNAFSQVIPFLAAPLLTRLFSPDDFAIYNHFLAIASMVGIVAAGRLEFAIPITKDKKEAQDVVFTGLALTLALTILSIAFPVFSDFFGRMYKSPELPAYLFLVPIAVLSFGLLGITNNWVLRQKRYNLLSIGKVAQSVINSGMAAFLGYIGWGVDGLVFGWLFGQFTGILVLLFFIDRKIDLKSFNSATIRTTIKEYRDFPLINSLHAFTDIFATQFALFWIITISYGMTELGLFAMMHKYVRAPIVLITSSVSTIFYAEMGSSLNSRKSPVPILKKTLFTSALFSLPFIATILLFGPQLFSWYFGKDWAIAGVYAQCITPMLFLTFIVSPISSIPILYNEQRKAYIIATIGYALTLSSIFLATYLGWTFTSSLIVYSLAFSVVQLFYLYWLYTLIKKSNAGSD